MLFLVDLRQWQGHNISSESFDWIFKAFTPEAPLQRVPVKLLRSLLARSYKLLRCDLPRNTLEVDYQTLLAKDSNDEFAKVFGVTSLESSNSISIQYPYSLTMLAEKLGFNRWHDANKLIQLIIQEKSINIKSSDNLYHQHVKVGKKMSCHKYSEECYQLLQKIKDGEAYVVNVQ